MTVLQTPWIFCIKRYQISFLTINKYIHFFLIYYFTKISYIKHLFWPPIGELTIYIWCLEISFSLNILFYNIIFILKLLIFFIYEFHNKFLIIIYIRNILFSYKFIPKYQRIYLAITDPTIFIVFRSINIKFPLS